MENFNVEMQNNQGEATLKTEDQKKIARILLQQNGDKLTAISTMVMPEFEGKGYGKKIFEALVAYVRKAGFKLIPKCPYILAQMEKNPEAYADIWV